MLPNQQTKMKPVFGSGYLIDTGDPLAYGLAAAWLFNESAGLVGYNSLTPIYNLSFPTSNWSWATGKYGSVLQRNSTFATSPGTILNPITIPSTTFSIACGLYFRGVPNGYGMVLGADATPAFFIKNPGGYNLDWFQTTDHLSATALVQNTYYDFVASFNAGALTYYINGIKDANTYSGFSTPSAFNRILDRGNDQSLTADLSYMYVWLNRAITQSDARRLIVEPYGFYLDPDDEDEEPMMVAAATVAAGYSPWFT